jgi:CRP-like cAMP-binding protein
MAGICRQNTFCTSIGESLQGCLCRACLHLTLRPKQELLFEQSSRQVAVITQGVVISLFLTPDGKQRCAELLKTGDLLGVDNLFHKATEQTGYMVALTDVSLCLFPVEAFQALYQQSADFSRAVLASLSARLHKSLNHLMFMQAASSEEKVSAIIDYLAAEDVDTSYLTHEDLGLIADLNRVTVTRAIKAIHTLEHQNGSA